MKNKIVLYTAVFGGYDGLIPQPVIPGVDRVCFTDRKIRSSSWDIMEVTPETDDPVRNSRKVKILAHRYLNQYDRSVYVDGNFLVVGDLNSLIRKSLSNANMAIFDHNQTKDDKRECVYEEYNALMHMGKISGFKDSPELMTRQIERYRFEGYPEHNGLLSGGVLIRKHNEPDVIRTMERWWHELEIGSRRDQLSFNYAAWKENFKFTVIDGDLRSNEWLHMIGIHRRSYFWKLFRYRLRRLLGIKKS
jgi:hypothetical protein